MTTIKTTLDDLAPWPSTRDAVTINALAAHITADTFARMLTAHEMGKTAFRPDSSPAEKTAYVTLMNHVADSFAVAHLLRTIAERMPDKADEIAADLWEEWDSGDSFADLLEEWLTGYGIDTERIIQAVKADGPTEPDMPRALLIDPDCRDGKCASCVGGPCEHSCHQTQTSEGDPR